MTLLVIDSGGQEEISDVLRPGAGRMSTHADSQDLAQAFILLRLPVSVVGPSGENVVPPPSV